MPNYKHLTHGKYHWFHYDQALTHEDQKFLSTKFGLNQEDLLECHKQKTQRPKVRSNKAYTYFIFHLPYKPTNSEHFSISELNVFITKTTLITVESIGNITALNAYQLQTKKSSKLLERRFKSGPASLFGKLMAKILSELQELIDTQGAQIDKLQQEVFKKHLAKRFIETVSLIRYNQIVAHNSLERQIRVFDQYRGESNPFNRLDPKSRSYWNQILDSIQATYFETESDMDHLEGLVKTFESLVTHHTNEVIKILTIFSVLLMPLTLISGIYGMNFVHMPLLTDPMGFIVISALMVLIASLMALIFKLKRWV